MIDTIFQASMYPFLFFSLYFQVLLLLSFFENSRKIKEEETQDVQEYPTVTIAVPCWNESATVIGTLESLLNLDYPKDKLGIIVVDNNSSDNTQEIIQDYKKRYPKQIDVLFEEKRGKHNAVNKALACSTADLFGCLDADSFVDKQALRIIVSYFEHHKEAMAVTPCIHIKSPKTIIQRLQAVEYLMGVFLRKSFGQLDAIQVTPGPFSIFKKEVFDSIGNYRKAHNTEDYEITLRMHEAHLKIMNSHKALVYTVGPSTIKGYFFQRLRWTRGFLENSIDYKKLFFKKEYGNFGVFTLPATFFFLFYGLYAVFFTLYLAIMDYAETVKRWSSVGMYLQMPTFDLFYINTTIISFIMMVMFTIFLLTLYIGNTLSDDRQEFYYNFPSFFLLYPLIAPIFLSRAIFDTVMKRKNEWKLQDTKTANATL